MTFVMLVILNDSDILSVPELYHILLADYKNELIATNFQALVDENVDQENYATA